MQHEIDLLLNLMRAQAEGILSKYTNMRIGTISSYDPSVYKAQVLIQPENMMTGWLPIATQWMGNGWGLYMPPAPGDTVIIHFMEGDLSVGIIGDRLFTSKELPKTDPAGCPSGEAWLLHLTGSYLQFKNDGTIKLKCLDTESHKTNFIIDANMVVNGNIVQTGNINQTGNITTSGDILDNASGPHVNTNTVRDMRDIYDSHVHPGVVIGVDDTMETTQTM